MDIPREDRFILIPELRTLIQKEIQAKRLKINACDVSNTEIVKKESSSESAILQGKVTIKVDDEEVEKNTIIKLSSYGSDALNNKGTLYEYNLYLSILFTIVNKRYTPHIICMYDGQLCSDNPSFNVWKGWDKIKRKIDKKIAQYPTNYQEQWAPIKHSLLVLVMEKSQGVTLFRTLPLISNDPSLGLNLLIQLVYTLYVFKHFQIIHNDLHLGNIFVEKLQQPATITYNIPELSFQLTTSYITRIYDYDRAYYKEKGNNPNLTGILCKQYGQCNEYDERRDLYKLLSGFLSHTSWFYPHFKTIVKADDLQPTTKGIEGALYTQQTRMDTPRSLANDDMLGVRETLMYLLSESNTPVLKGKVPYTDKNPLVFTHPEA